MSVTPHTTADGFITTDDIGFLAKVAQAVDAAVPALSPQLWHSGGGIFGIQITRGDGAQLLWGDCDGRWCADVTNADSEMLDGIETDRRFNPAEDVQKVAAELIAASLQ